MVVQKIRDSLDSDCVIFDNHAYDKSIIGVTTDNIVVYDYNKMVQELQEDEGWSIDDCIEWINYNTLRAYSSDNRTPIVMYPLDD